MESGVDSARPSRSSPSSARASPGPVLISHSSQPCPRSSDTFPSFADGQGAYNSALDSAQRAFGSLQSAGGMQAFSSARLLWPAGAQTDVANEEHTAMGHASNFPLLSLQQQFQEQANQPQQQQQMIRHGGDERTGGTPVTPQPPASPLAASFLSPQELASQEQSLAGNKAAINQAFETLRSCGRQLQRHSSPGDMGYLQVSPLDEQAIRQRRSLDDQRILNAYSNFRWTATSQNPNQALATLSLAAAGLSSMAEGQQGLADQIRTEEAAAAAQALLGNANTAAAATASGGLCNEDLSLLATALGIDISGGSAAPGETMHRALAGFSSEPTNAIASMTANSPMASLPLHMSDMGQGSGFLLQQHRSVNAPQDLDMGLLNPNRQIQLDSIPSTSDGVIQPGMDGLLNQYAMQQPPRQVAVSPPVSRGPLSPLDWSMRGVANELQQSGIGPDGRLSDVNAMFGPAADMGRLQPQKSSRVKFCNSLYKTEICRSWEQFGGCRYGEKCQFAHGKEDLKMLPRPAKYKTEVCRTFTYTGMCPYGPRCRFIHTMLTPPSPQPGAEQQQQQQSAQMQATLPAAFTLQQPARPQRQAGSFMPVEYSEVAAAGTLFSGLQELSFPTSAPGAAPPPASSSARRQTIL